MKDNNEEKTLDEILEGVDDLELYFPYTFDFAYERSGKLEMIFDNNTDELVKYEGCEEEVRIPGGVTAIGPAAFSHNVSLCSVDIPDSVEKIGDYAFYNCPRVTVHFGKNVKHIGKCAFISGNGNWYQMDLPDSIEFIGDGALIFLGFDKLPKSLKHIGIEAFARGYWGNRGFGESAFDNDAEWYAEIPNKVTEIGDFAFVNLTLGDNCKGIRIPLSVKKIGKKAFTHIMRDDKRETIFCYEGSEEQWKAIEIDNADNWLKEIKVEFNCKCN